MLGNISMESFTQEFNLGNDFRVSEQSNRFEFGRESQDLSSGQVSSSSLELLGTGFNQSVVSSSVSWEGNTLRQSSESFELQNAPSGYPGGSFTQFNEQVTTVASGVELSETTSFQRWESDQFSATSTTSDFVITDNSIPKPTPTLEAEAGVAAQTSLLEINTQSMNVSTGFGLLSMSTQATSLPGQGEMQTLETVWSFESELSGFRIGGTSSKVSFGTPMNFGAPNNLESTKELGTQQSWIQSTQQSSISLEFPSSFSNPASSVLNGWSVQQESSLTRMGSGQIEMQTQTMDVFGQFAGTNISSQWMNQTTNVMDVSLAIA